MPVHDDLGVRMKTFYEQIPKTKLMRRCPVAIRIDGKAFHTFTRGFQKPFDEVLIKSMQGTMKYLCENIQGCVLGYTQSDEITLILIDYKKLTSSAWFDYEVQKICSIAASMATMAFNKYFYDNVFVYNATATVDLSNKKYPFKEVYSLPSPLKIGISVSIIHSFSDLEVSLNCAVAMTPLDSITILFLTQQLPLFR